MLNEAFFRMLGVAFIALKLSGNIDWHWIFVLMPLIIGTVHIMITDKLN